MKQLLPICILVCSLSGSAITLFEDDFESGNLDHWTLNDPSHWDNSLFAPISGFRSLQHHDIGAESESTAYAETPFTLATGTTAWRFSLKNGEWDPSGGNRFWVYLTGLTNGYVVGINLTGTDDRLTLWRITGENIDDELISSSLDWNADTTVGIEVQRSPAGTWTLLHDSTGGFDNLTIAGTATDVTYTTSSRFGLHFDFTSTRAGELWMDDVLITQAVLSDEPPVLDFIGDKTVFERNPLIFSVIASDPIDGDPVTLSASGLPPGSVFTNGLFTWNSAVPVGAYQVTFTATDKDGSDSETITINILERPALLISEVADPSGTGADAYRFVELYNAGNNVIDLAADEWNLSIQKNGSSWGDIELTGTISAAGTYVIAKNQVDFTDEYGEIPNQEDARVDGNGDDAYGLYSDGDHSSGTLIDIYGEFNISGEDTAWEYTDGKAERQVDILGPNNIWIASEWHISSADTGNMTPGAHGPRPQLSPITDPFVFTGDSLSLSISASNVIYPNDSISITADPLPDDATLTGEKGTGNVTAQFIWNTPPEGIYPITFTATGRSGASHLPVTITVSDHSTLNEWFYRWKGKNEIYKLGNGQFWQQTSRETYGDYGLFYPTVFIEPSGTDYEMTVQGVSGSITVQHLKNVTETYIRGLFSGYKPGRIVELYNGTFWRQISSETSARSSILLDTLQWETEAGFCMKGEGEEDIVFVEKIDITPSNVTGLFSGLSRSNIYTLEDETSWKQISSENFASSVDSVTAWRWTEDGNTWIQFVDGNNTSIGTCQVKSVDPPEHPPVVSRIDGWFYGWKGQRVFALQNGQFWQQLTPATAEQTLGNPQVTITFVSDNWQMRVENALPPAYVNVQQLTNVVHLTAGGWFYGFEQNRIFQFSDHSWWRQTSRGLSTFTRFKPDVYLWADSGSTRLEMPEIAQTVEIEALDALHESPVTNAFSGLHYGNLYELSDGTRWIQTSSEHIKDNTDQPMVMLWRESNHTNLLIYDKSDRNIGTCTVVNPDADDDADGTANFAEIIAGTGLNNASDRFLIKEIRHDAEGLVILSWIPAEGRNYTVEWTPSLNKSFQTLETDIEWPKNCWTNYLIENDGFYRIRVQLKPNE